MPVWVVTALGLGWLIATPSEPAAQPIRSNVTVQALVKPEGRQLRLLVRAPLGAIRDADVPTYGIGFLDLAAAQRPLRDAVRRWIADVEIFENGELLGVPRVAAARVSLPSDRSFVTYEAALAHVRSPPLPVETELYWEQAVLDVLFEYPIGSDRSAFSIDPSLERSGVRINSVLRFLPPDGAVRTFEYTGNPGRIWLDPRWHQAAWHFVLLGVDHLLSSIDQLVFLACLVLPFRTVRSLVVVVTSFAVAHSLTLTASAFTLAPNVLWFPPLIETLIAMSVLYMAFENIVGPTLRQRWVSTFGFGLIHGFAFSFALPPAMQFAGSHVAISRLAFNLGLEAGQLLALAVLLPILAVLFRRVITERVGIVLVSVFVAHSGWHWLTERGGELGRFQFQRPVYDAIFFASAMRWAMLLVIAGGLIWLGRNLVGPWAASRATDAGPAAGSS